MLRGVASTLFRQLGFLAVVLLGWAVITLVVVLLRDESLIGADLSDRLIFVIYFAWLIATVSFTERR